MPAYCVGDVLAPASAARVVLLAHADELGVDAELDAAHGHGAVEVALRLHRVRQLVQVAVDGGEDAAEHAEHQEQDDEQRVVRDRAVRRRLHLLQENTTG